MGVTIDIHLSCDWESDDKHCTETHNFCIQDSEIYKNINEMIEEEGWLVKDDGEVYCHFCVDKINEPSKEDILTTIGDEKYHAMIDEEDYDRNKK